MSKEKYANEPLLFIQQNNTTFPMAPMQERFVTPKKKTKVRKEAISKVKEPINDEVTMEEVTEEKPIETPKKKYSSKKAEQEEPNFQTDTVDSLEHKEEESKVEEDQQPVRERKQFRDMSIRERVEYFANTSEYAPKMKCEVKTRQRTFRGIIVSFKEEEVVFQSGRKMQQIPFEEIRAVRLLGF
ncbi:CotO family spore coat protein [Oceanobacillus sp. Castelsardo]|uniref:CotO family spore coat protein n=1 Tax=Oceanobacillus sp. Castelsardo TaxID=1851204 RepID=UPI000838AE78|nr:CotO family spore coat protein [Oceanobacillus sp. Castelsardo]